MNINKVLVVDSTKVCPSCGETLAVPRYVDGDSIPNLWNILAEIQTSRTAINSVLLVGHCKSCDANFYSIIASFMDAQEKDAEPYLHGNVEMKMKRNFICSLSTQNKDVPEQWLMCEFDTPLGIMQQHEFGPFVLKSSKGVIGESGVSHCSHNGKIAKPWIHGQNLLLAVWDDLQEMLLKQNGKTMEKTGSIYNFVVSGKKYIVGDTLLCTNRKGIPSDILLKEVIEAGLIAMGGAKKESMETAAEWISEIYVEP